MMHSIIPQQHLTVSSSDKSIISFLTYAIVKLSSCSWSVPQWTSKEEISRVLIADNSVQIDTCISADDFLRVHQSHNVRLSVYLPWFSEHNWFFVITLIITLHVF
jgi:hypothetical protein